MDDPSSANQPVAEAPVQQAESEVEKVNQENDAANQKRKTSWLFIGLCDY